MVDLLLPPFLVITRYGNTCSGSFQVYALDLSTGQSKTIMSMGFDQSEDNGTEIRKIRPKRNFRNKRLSYRNNGNCCWKLYKRCYFIHITFQKYLLSCLGSIFNSKVPFIRFGFRGSHVKLEIGDNNEEIAFFPRSLQLIECPN